MKNDHIIGIGGIFFRSKDPKSLQKWYEDNLGFTQQVPYDSDDTAVTFRWKTFQNENQNTVWAPFKEDTTYFDPSKKDFVVNYIVRNMKGLLEQLKSRGIEQQGDVQSTPYGKFSWIIDPEGNKIEFWEPDKEFFKDKY